MRYKVRYVCMYGVTNIVHEISRMAFKLHKQIYLCKPGCMFLGTSHVYKNNGTWIFNKTRNVAIELPKIPNMYGMLEEVKTSSELHKSQGEHLLVINI